MSDAYGLPLVRPGRCVPSWIKRRRRYLKKLSPAARNNLLTGDPFFAFDNTAYDAEWTTSLPQAPVVARAVPEPPGPAPIHPPAVALLPPVPPVVPPDQDRAPPLPPPHTPHDGGRLLLERFRLINAETPPRGLFDPAPPGSPLSPSPTSPDAPPPGCLLPRTPTSPSVSVADPAVALDGSVQPLYWLRSSPDRHPPARLSSSSSSSRSRLSSWSRGVARQVQRVISTADDFVGELLDRRPSLLLAADRAVLVHDHALLPACRLAALAGLALKTNNHSGDQNQFSSYSFHFFLFNSLLSPCSPVHPEPRPLLLQP